MVSQSRSLSQRHKLALLYHNIFDYPLTKDELHKWSPGKKVKFKGKIPVESYNNFFFLKGKKALVKKRLERERLSIKKIKIARKVVNTLKHIPTVYMVALTGSLAMKNASKSSDIDLMIITSSNTLWVTRALSFFALKAGGFRLRRAGEKDEKDKLCLNLWLDASTLRWSKKNIFTAHEIAQVVPLLNKGKTYEKFISKNSWILDYWPNANEIKKVKTKENFNFWALMLGLFNPLMFKLQYLYMKPKITREVVTRTRAEFHPHNWSQHVHTKGF